MRHEDIAIALGINSDTLRKYYELELSVGANVRRLEALKGLHRAAKRGSSSAAKAYLAIDPQIAAPPHTPKDADAPAAEPKLGKKDQAQADAVSAQDGSQWDGLLPRSPGLH